ncbi:MAG: hypothetical protein C0619_04235, partial [Desulfuromonas sp.]
MLKLGSVASVLISLILLVLFSCSDSNTNAPADGGAHPLTWLNPAVAENHGAVASQEGNQSCTSCHGAELDGSGDIPGCYECHFDASGSRVPPGSGWSHGVQAHVALSASVDTCNRCHDVFRQFELAPSTCHDCHPGTAHPVGEAWLDKASATFHGLSAAQDVTACAACHGADYQGGLTGVSCSQCHFGETGSKVPAGESWTHGSTPHDGLTPYIAVCNQCHTVNRSYGNGPASCHDCHTGASHPVGEAWLDKASATFHGDAATQDVTACAVCHGADYQGGFTGVSCFQCHFGETGSKVPAGESWTHGSVPHDSLTQYVAICDQCHTVNRSYGNGPTTCHDCHTSASHPVGETWLDKNSATFHGLSAAQDVTACAVCHGTDYQGGFTGVSCFQCHFGATGSKVPAGESWTHGSVPHDGLTPYVAVCEQCHTVNRSYGNGPTTCHDCHSGASHPVGEAWLDKNSATFHGLSAVQDVTACAVCHGTDYQGGFSGVSCFQCHFGETGSKVPAGESWTHGSTPHDGLTPYIAVCNQCHTVNRSYGNGPASCHDCHTGA